MAELLNTLVEYLWIADFIVLCALGVLAFQQQQFSSSVITQSTVIIISGTIIQFEQFVFSIVAPAENSMAFNLWIIGFGLFDIVLIAVLIGLFYKVIKATVHSALLRISYGCLGFGFVIATIFGQYTTLYLGENGISYKFWELLVFHLGSCMFYGLAIFAISKAHELANMRYMLIARTYILAFSVATLLQVSMLFERYFFETGNLIVFYKWSIASISIGTTAIAIAVTILGVWQYYTKRQRQGLLWTP